MGMNPPSPVPEKPNVADVGNNKKPQSDKRIRDNGISVPTRGRKGDEEINIIVGIYRPH